MFPLCSVAFPAVPSPFPPCPAWVTLPQAAPQVSLYRTSTTVAPTVAVLAVVTRLPLHPMASASLPVHPAPLHFTPAGSETDALADGDGDLSAPAFFLSPPPSVRKNTAATTTSPPTTPERNIVSRRFPPPEPPDPPDPLATPEEPSPGRASCGWSYGPGVSGVHAGPPAETGAAAAVRPEEGCDGP